MNMTNKSKISLERPRFSSRVDVDLDVVYQKSPGEFHSRECSSPEKQPISSIARRCSMTARQLARCVLSDWRLPTLNPFTRAADDAEVVKHGQSRGHVALRIRITA